MTDRQLCGHGPLYRSGALGVGMPLVLAAAMLYLADEAHATGSAPPETPAPRSPRSRGASTSPTGPRR